MKKGITKRELEITDPQKIQRILEDAKVLHLGMVDGDEPYVVPMNYGYTLENGCLRLYMHGATKGRKLDVLRANNKVFFCMETDVIPFDGDVACQYGTAYTSLMGSGTARLLDDPAEKMAAMSVLMKTQTGKDFSFNEGLVSIVSVIEINVSHYTAKQRPLPPRKLK